MVKEHWDIRANMDTPPSSKVHVFSGPLQLATIRGIGSLSRGDRDERAGTARQLNSTSPGINRVWNQHMIFVALVCRELQSQRSLLRLFSSLHARSQALAVPLRTAGLARRGNDSPFPTVSTPIAARGRGSPCMRRARDGVPRRPVLPAGAPRIPVPDECNAVARRGRQTTEVPGKQLQRAPQGSHRVRARAPPSC
ncbi:hypothetical protein P171DRAFT_230772 [Karstenula rhodostoma CBS 690.94]|uniref:Uncharacterized protein n=1 Tax=Karstenula rhodostoma CBS 690.94 TaxID=1392251 RepID=A0A9P4UFP5_9PLEO|nr:hypothetical protein P171DRAFT_230772 [Karstenula rhodostoma CBS 690.94]